MHTLHNKHPESVRDTQNHYKSAVNQLYRILTHNSQQRSYKKHLPAIDLSMHSDIGNEKNQRDVKRVQGWRGGEKYHKVELKRNSWLQGFNRKGELQYAQIGKKMSSIQQTNLKLKNIILGRKQLSHKTNKIFFQQQREQISPSQQLGRYIQRVVTEVCKQNHPICEKEIITEQEEQEEQKDKIIQDKTYLYLRKKQRLKNKLKISGQNVENKTKKEEKDSPKQKYSERLVITDNTNKKKCESQQVLSSPITNKTATKTKYKKQSMTLTFKKNFPNLLISEHILWKLDQMLKFSTILLQSFNCKLLTPLSIQLPKFSRKQVSLTYYIGNGNNRGLLVELMSRRWWWRQVGSWQQANFVWTQHKINKCMGKQKNRPQSTDCQPDKLIDQKIIVLSAVNSIYAKHSQNISKFKQIASPSLLHNHFSMGHILGDKKQLFTLLQTYILKYKQKPNQLFQIIPQTYLIINSNINEQLQRLQQRDCLWIVKPGQNSNRGKGIFITHSLEQIKQTIHQKTSTTTIVQKYITNPLLYKGRKFDIRTYLLVIVINGITKYYWYEQGYIRTSSHLYNNSDLNCLLHLTNDAVQSQGDAYGKYQKGNKLSYQQLQIYIDSIGYQWKIQTLVKQMKKITKIVADASYPLLDPLKQSIGFQLFGLDFLVDENFKPWLLEVNTNPCLELSSPLLQTLMPTMLQNVLRITIDALYPPLMLPSKEYEYTLPQKMQQNNKFQLLFDSSIDKDQQWQQHITIKTNI